MSKGYEKLKQSVMKDIEENNGIFNPNGCNKCGAKCLHKYCNQFKWVIDKAKNYSEKTNIPWEELLDKWEENRSYWYMNYYQESNFPDLTEKVKCFETLEDFKYSVGKSGYRCPYCKGISTQPTRCDSGLLVNLINKKGKNSCNWSAGGFFGTLGQGEVIFIKEISVPIEIFTPVAWEKENKNEV